MARTTAGIHTGVEIEENRAEMAIPNAMGSADDIPMTTVHPYVVRVIPSRMPPPCTPLMMLVRCDKTVVPLVRVEYQASPQIALGDLACSNRGDGFPVLSKKKNGSNITVTIGNHPFMEGDKVLVSTRRIDQRGTLCDILSTDETSVTLHWSTEFPDNAILILPLAAEDVDEEKIIFAGIVGPIQPQQFYTDQLSIFTIVSGIAKVTMEPNDLIAFLPGDTVYMSIEFDSKDQMWNYCARFRPERTRGMCFMIGMFVNGLDSCSAEIIVRVGEGHVIQ